MNAPSIAPKLLPLPPTISITQMMNVASSGSNTNGSTYRNPCAYSAPAYTHHRRAQNERLQLEPKHILARSRRRLFVLPYRAQRPDPTASLSRAGYREVQRRERHDHHREIQQVVLVRRRPYPPGTWECCTVPRDPLASHFSFRNISRTLSAMPSVDMAR